MRILLVEDEAPLRETLAARLKREGFAVDTPPMARKACTSAAKCRSTSPSSTSACRRCPAWTWSRTCATPASDSRS